jgi:hypothetical protein
MYHAENSSDGNITITAYDKDGKTIACRMTRINYGSGSDYAYVCDSGDGLKNKNATI